MTKELRLALGGGLICVSVLLVLLSPGCSNMPNGGVPIYIRIDSPTVVIDNARFGSGSFRIPDVWAESGSQNLGAYEMPVSIPVLAGGNVPILISGGIYDNGIINTRVSYPFYKPDTFTIPNAIPGHVYHHKPVYHYFASTQVALNSTFEGNNDFDSKMTLISNAHIAFEGARCGAIIMHPADSTITTIQSQPMAINTQGGAAYIELNYRNPAIYFDVYLRATNYDNFGNVISQTDYPKLTIGLHPEWSKTYLNFSNEAGYNPGADFQIIFVTYRLPTINTTNTTDSVLLDNIKFLYFN